MLLMCIVTLLASAVFSGIARMRLQNLLRDSGTDIGVSASEMSADTLLEKSVSAAQDFIAAKAEVLDAYLKNNISSSKNTHFVQRSKISPQYSGK